MLREKTDRGSKKLAQKWRLIADEMAEVERRLQTIVAKAGPEIAEVGGYVLNGRGKRVRPALFLYPASLSPQGLAPSIDAAVALELIHTASLLHDDVIDQAATRRGKDAVHVRWSNKVSILTGDYFLSHALKMLVAYHHWPLMEIMVNLVQNMAEGEIEQAFAEPQSADLEERYFKWIGKKSASFFAGCCRAGCFFGSGDSGEADTWAEYGFNLGMAFQLIDDLLDYTGEKQATGKPVYGDLNNKIITLPLIRTMRFERDGGSLHCLLQHEEASDKQFTSLVQAVLDSDGPDYTYREAEKYALRADDAVEKLQHAGKELKVILKDLTGEVLKRTG